MLLNFVIILGVVIFFLNISLSFTIIFLERKTPQSTIAWLLSLWIVPVLGFVFYLFLSQNLTKRKIFKYNTPENLRYSVLLKQQRRSFSEGVVFSQSSLEKYRQSIEFHLNVSQALYTQNNILEVYTDGKSKFDALFNAMEEATSSIHVEYYIIKHDDLANQMMDILIRKAIEGVEVRFLFDAMGGRYLPKSLLNTLRSAGGQVGVFFPSKFKMLNIRVNYRNHRKIVVIDGKTGFIGGFNVGNEYLGLDEKMGFWRDTHLKIDGSSVYELQLRFLLDWRASSSETLVIEDDCQDKYFPPIPGNNPGAGVQIVSSGPDKANQQIKQGFLRLINNAESYILIQSPYFVPDESILESLKIALLSGVDVRIMIPNKPDHIFIHWATLSYVGELIDYGAKVYIYEKGFLHAKTIVVDDAVSSVGSCNFDIRSFRLNFETNTFIYDTPFAIKLKDIFVNDMKHCTYYNKETYSKRNHNTRVKESVSRLFSPLL
ncbi:MAG: cardiolipin synthase [Eubacteriaceae bacterium]